MGASMGAVRRRCSPAATRLLLLASLFAVAQAAEAPQNAAHRIRAFATLSDAGELGAVLCRPHGCHEHPAYHVAPAEATFSPSEEHSSGFGVLDVRTSDRYGDVTQLKAAGFLEGRLTARATFDHYYNMKAWLEKESAVGGESRCLLPSLAAQLLDDSDDAAGAPDEDADDEADDAAVAACATGDAWDAEASLECRRAPPQAATPAGACRTLGGGVGDTVKAIMKWLQKMDRWVAQKVSGRHSRYYEVLAAVQAQLDGFIAGYTTAAEQGRRFPTLARKDFTLLNGLGDANSLMKALKADTSSAWLRTGGVDLNATHSEALLRAVNAQGHCSAVVKLSGDLNDLWLGHSTWYTYASMTRIWKTYNFSLAAGNGVSAFSSYPGMLSSLDDFYLLGRGMAVLQTSNPVLDLSLYDRISEHSVPTWMRTRVANVLGATGPHWARAFSRKNSGTYNNQYMVVDLKRLERGQRLKGHTLTVVEQIPGLVKWADLSQQLERSYWPSYNIPYFREVYDASGFTNMVAAAAQRGLGRATMGLSYQSSPRADIFRRSVGAVDSVAALQRFMRYNDWQHDAYSAGGAGDAICARFDLLPSNPSPDGCTDSKVTSLDWMADLRASVINGPTTEQQPPFSWANYSDTSHHAMPEEFTFEWETVEPHVWPAPGVLTADSVLRGMPRRQRPVLGAA